MIHLKLKLTLTAIFLASTSLFSQNFYVSASSGYAFPVNGESDILYNQSTIDYDNYQTNEHYYTQELEALNVSFGKGYTFGISGGYMFNSYLGVDLGFSYLTNGRMYGEQKNHNTYIDNTGKTTITDNSYVSTTRSDFYRIVPSLVLTPGFEKFNPYLKVGVIMGFGTLTMEHRGYDFWQQADIYRLTEYSGGVSIGLNTQFGVSYELTDKWAIYAEGTFSGMSYSPQKLEVLAYVVNDVDQLPNMDRAEKETIFEKTTSYDSRDNTYDPDSPRTFLAINMPMSSLGFNIGVKYNF
jgi:hypothetical protein